MQTAVPRWRGFNLQYFFTAGRYSAPVEDDFRWVRDLGFDFIRLPMSYRIWLEGDDVYKIKEAPFENIDRVIEWGQKYKIHTSLNFHRGPGYCINRGETEPFNLWKDAEALDAFCFHWDSPLGQAASGRTLRQVGQAGEKRHRRTLRRSRHL